MKLKRCWLYLALLSACYGFQANASPWPEANPDSVTTSVDQSLTIEVLKNDVGEGLTLIAVNATTTAGGSALLSADKQTVVYQPRTGFTGSDEFWYDFEDTEGRKNAAKVTVNVSDDTDVGEKPVQWPVATTDTMTVTDSQNTAVSVLTNDIGSGLSIKTANEWSLNGGRITVNADKQSLSYATLIPQSEWPTTDEFWYVIEDAWGRTNAAKVTVSLGYGEAPEAWPSSLLDNATTLINTPVSINVLENDEGTALKLKSVNQSSVKWGTIVIDGDKLVYTPRYNFAGSDEFWYVFEDAWGRTNSAKVKVSVRSLVMASTLNDTGVKNCGDYAFESSGIHNNDLTDCTATQDGDGDPIPPGQDALTGRDVTDNDDRDGVAGFSFTKLGGAGEPLPSNAAEWSCIKDNTTGLIWESKKGKGLGVGAAGLHSADDRFTNVYANDTANASCFAFEFSNPDATCYVESFVARVNAEGLCGITDWRLPVFPELESLVNYGNPDVAIDTAYFPNTILNDHYQSASLNPLSDVSIFNLSFLTGETIVNNRAVHVRLVSNSALSE